MGVTPFWGPELVEWGRLINHQLSSILFGDTMVPNIEQDYILLLGYSFLYKEYNLTMLRPLTQAQMG